MACQPTSIMRRQSHQIAPRQGGHTIELRTRAAASRSVAWMAERISLLYFIQCANSELVQNCSDFVHGAANRALSAPWPPLPLPPLFSPFISPHLPLTPFPLHPPPFFSFLFTLHSTKKLPHFPPRRCRGKPTARRITQHVAALDCWGGVGMRRVHSDFQDHSLGGSHGTEARRRGEPPRCDSASRRRWHARSALGSRRDWLQR